MISPDQPYSDSQEPETAPDSEDTSIWTLDSLTGIEPGAMRMVAWISLHIRRCRSLADDQVLGWYAWRMALRENGPDGQPQFDDPSMPFIQCTRVFVRTLKVGWVFFDTELDDDTWGIYADRVASMPEYGNEGIFSEGPLDNLPKGKIDAVEVRLSPFENIERVMLSVEGKRIWLIAADAYEQFDGSLKLMERDEQIFLFTDEKALSTIQWVTSLHEPIIQHSSWDRLSESMKGWVPLGKFTQFIVTVCRRWFVRS